MVTLVCFSPTHGTRAYGRAVARRLSADFEEIDLTDPEVRAREHVFGPGELVVFGAPVYYGRLPQLDGGLFDRVRGADTPAVFLVSYGNRDYDDALLEEKEICGKNGFRGIAAAAFIAPHTFCPAVGAGRPEADDLAVVDRFAAAVRAAWEQGERADLNVPGNVPYKEYKGMPFVPAADETCNACGVCVRLCPTRSIRPDKPRETEPSTCIGCFACVKNCPRGSRAIREQPFRDLIAGLEKRISVTRKEPQCFVAGRSALI